MPTDQPNDAPDDLKPRDPDTPGAVLSDPAMDETPGGGGLGGLARAAADPLAGAGANTGGASPNSPIDVGVAPEAADEEGEAEAEARLQASRDVPEPGQSSQ